MWPDSMRHSALTKTRSSLMQSLRFSGMAFASIVLLAACAGGRATTPILSVPGIWAGTQQRAGAVPANPALPMFVAGNAPKYKLFVASYGNDTLTTYKEN